MKIFLINYEATIAFNALVAGSFMKQGSLVLCIFTAIHQALLSTLFWCLLATALVATQMVEDGSMSSLLPIFMIWIFCFMVSWKLFYVDRLAFGHELFD